MRKITINKSKCDGCGFCVRVCPEKALVLKELTDSEIKDFSLLGRIKVKVKGREKAHVQFAESCVYCEMCMENCHEKAISISPLYNFNVIDEYQNADPSFRIGEYFI